MNRETEIEEEQGCKTRQNDKKPRNEKKYQTKANIGTENEQEVEGELRMNDSTIPTSNIQEGWQSNCLRMETLFNRQRKQAMDPEITEFISLDVSCAPSFPVLSHQDRWSRELALLPFPSVDRILYMLKVLIGCRDLFF